ncbi:MAG: hypothetical protein E7656_07270 [Ruminococcaceae bacterium]|nr:hypothetical protein [Oscillospiraceae bacterium]
MKKNKKVTRKLTKKGKLLAWIVGLAAVLALLLLLSEVILPSVEKSVKESANTQRAEDDEEGETKLFYSGLTPEQLEGYAECDKSIFYSVNGMGGHLTAENAVALDGERGLFWVKYIDAVMQGDEKAYSALFSKKFDFSNPIERYASGELDFPPQRLHNIKIELWREETDPETGVTESVFYVEYNIYRNEGDFRADMSYDTAPIAVTVTESDGTVLITDVKYRYN